jgi:hypothetical protein
VKTLSLSALSKESSIGSLSSASTNSCFASIPGVPTLNRAPLSHPGKHSGKGFLSTLPPAAPDTPPTMLQSMGMSRAPWAAASGSGKNTPSTTSSSSGKSHPHFVEVVVGNGSHSIDSTEERPVRGLGIAELSQRALTAESTDLASESTE